MSRYRVAVDVGGTFTDVFVLDEETSAANVAKVPSTPHDPMEAIMNGVGAASVALPDVTLFSHGTTVATNALITRRFPKVAMVTTRGFRDVLEIRRGTKDDLWDAYKDVAPAIIPRRDRLEVTERIDYRGEILTPLDEDEARAVVEDLRARDVETVAVCFINAYANPANELRMREILEAELPGVTISTSSEVLPEIFEYERFSTTVANAVLSPLVGGYVKRLGAKLRDGGYDGDLLLLHSGGGVMTEALVSSTRCGSPRRASRRRDRLPPARDDVRLRERHRPGHGRHEHRHLARLRGRDAHDQRVVGRVRPPDLLPEHRDPDDRRRRRVARLDRPRGVAPQRPPVGGSGSRSRVLRPRRRPADQQRREPRARPARHRAGGRRDDARPRTGRGRIRDGVAEPLGLELLDAASAVIQVANANMADAVRLISIRRGYDPRDFALVAFGGAGALHGAALAKELSIPTVIVPPNPGITSALGCLLVDVRHDLATMYLRPLPDADPGEIEAEFVKLEDEARERMREEGVPDEHVSLQRSIAMRYLGQWRSLSVSVDGEITSLDGAVARFHDEHEREFTYRRDNAPVEVYQLGLRAIGVTPKPDFKAQELTGRDRDPSRSPRGRSSSTRAPGWSTRRSSTASGSSPATSLAGPAIIEQFDSTVVVPPGVTAALDEWGIIRMNIEEPAS